MINYKTKWNLPRTFNHCISPLLKSATHNNITPQIIFLKLSPTPPRPFPQFAIPFPLILRHHYAHTNEPKQITNCNQITCAGLYPTQTSPRRAITIVFPNPINATLPQIKHATNYPRNPTAPTTLRTRTPPPTHHPSEKNDAIHPHPFPQFTISFQLILRHHYAHTNEPKQITNCNQPALFGYLFHHHTTSTTAIPNQIFHKKESPRHNGGDAVLLSP